MRTIQGVRAGWLVGALGACILIVGAARADVATERPGSILIFPKVVRDGTRDTVIQITNTGNSTNSLRCFFLDAEAGRSGRPVCSEQDFNLTLTRQQPTHFRASTGRRINPSDAFGAPDAGLDPGLVPALNVGFVGALVCVEVGPDGFPMAQNKLKGEATIQSNVGADESKYNAITLQGKGSVGKDNILDLNGTEYDACPATNIVNFLADGGPDPVIEAFGNGGICTGGSSPGAPCNSTSDCPGGGASCTTGRSSVVTNLTVLPCNLDFANGIPGSLVLQFAVVDEFEVATSGSTRGITCWDSFNLGQIPAMRSNTLPGGGLATEFATVRIRSTVGGPFVAVAESFHTDSIGATGAAAVNVHVEGTDPTAKIRITDQ